MKEYSMLHLFPFPLSDISELYSFVKLLISHQLERTYTPQELAYSKAIAQRDMLEETWGIVKSRFGVICDCLKGSTMKKLFIQDLNLKCIRSSHTQAQFCTWTPTLFIFIIFFSKGKFSLEWFSIHNSKQCIGNYMVYY